MKYLAIDAHIGTSELSVRDAKGLEKDHQVIPTEARQLIETLQSYRGKKTLMVEESNLAGWMKRTLEPYVTRFIVCNPKHNAWIAKDEEKDDPIDARKLSHLLWGGYYKEVHHPSAPQQHLKNLVLHYHRVTKAVARTKNQINAKFRENGIRCSGYSNSSLNHLDRLTQLELSDLYDLLEATETIQKRARKHLIQETAHFSQIQRFKKLPGIGPIHAATFFTIVDTPHRFPSKSKLWTYCGLGLKRRKSGGKVYRQTRNQEYNRYLKSMAKRSALIATNQKDSNRYQRQFLRLIGEGEHPEQAQITVARSIVSTLWGMWKSGQNYDPDIDLH